MKALKHNHLILLLFLLVCHTASATPPKFDNQPNTPQKPTLKTIKTSTNRLSLKESVEQVVALYQGLLWLANSLDEISNKKELDNAISLVKTQYFLITSRLQYMRVPEVWCQINYNSLPQNRYEIQQVINTLGRCIKALENEVKALEKHPVIIPKNTQKIAQNIQETARKIAQKTHKKDNGFDVFAYLRKIAERLGLYKKKQKNTSVDWSFFDKISMVIAVVLFVFIVVLVIKIASKTAKKMRKKQVKSAQNFVITKEKISATNAWNMAEEALKNGKLRYALRLFFHAWIDVLSTGFGIEKPADDETNHEWFSRIESLLPPQIRSDTITLIHLFDTHWYGISEPSKESVKRFREQLLKLADNSKK